VHAVPFNLSFHIPQTRSIFCSTDFARNQTTHLVRLWRESALYQFTIAGIKKRIQGSFPSGGLPQFCSTFEFTILTNSGAILHWSLTLSDPEPISLRETDFRVSIAWTESSTKATVDWLALFSLLNAISVGVFAVVDLRRIFPFKATLAGFLRSISNPLWSLLVLRIGIASFLVLVCFCLLAPHGLNLQISVLVASFVLSGFPSQFLSLYIAPLYGVSPWQFGLSGFCCFTILGTVARWASSPWDNPSLAFEIFWIDVICVGHLICVCLATLVVRWCNFAPLESVCLVKRDVAARGRSYSIVFAEFLSTSLLLFPDILNLVAALVAEMPISISPLFLVPVVVCVACHVVLDGYNLSVQRPTVLLSSPPWYQHILIVWLAILLDVSLAVRLAHSWRYLLTHFSPFVVGSLLVALAIASASDFAVFCCVIGGSSRLENI
jgi:hypothetical protein